MADYFDIYGTHIPISAIKDFRMIKVEFIFWPVFRESKNLLMTAISRKKYEFAYMEPYAAIIGQQGHKSELGEYKAKDFKEALGKDISGAVIYTIADKLKLKAFKQQKYQCVNLAGRAFTTYLDDVPAKMMWAGGRTAEVYKEDKLYTVLNEITTPGVEYISALVIKANEVFCFYGDGVQLEDAGSEYERLKQEQEASDSDVFDFFVNMENIHLQTEIKPFAKDEAKMRLYKARYKYAMVLVGLSILGYYANNKEEDSPEEKVRLFSQMISPVLLPMIEVMGSDMSDVLSE